VWRIRVHPLVTSTLLTVAVASFGPVTSAAAKAPVGGCPAPYEAKTIERIIAENTTPENEAVLRAGDRNEDSILCIYFINEHHPGDDDTFVYIDNSIVGRS
jgi:hypothetical protein